MKLFLKKLLSAFLILNHLWVFNFLSASEIISVGSCCHYQSEGQDILIHLLTKKSDCYAVSFDDSLKNVSSPLYFYDASNRNILGVLKKEKDIFVNEWWVDHIQLDRTHDVMKVVGQGSVTLGKEFNADIDVKALSIKFTAPIYSNYSLSLTAENLSITQGIKAKELYLTSVQRGLIKNSLQAECGIFLKGEWENQSTIESGHDFIVEGGFFENKGSINTENKYLNHSSVVFENGMLNANHGVLMDAKEVEVNGKIESPYTEIKSEKSITTRTTRLGDYVVLSSIIKELHPFLGATPESDYALKIKTLLLFGNGNSHIHVKLNVDQLIARDRYIEFQDSLEGLTEGTFPTLDFICDCVAVDVTSFYAKSFFLTAETFDLRNCGNLFIQSGFWKVEDGVNIDSIGKALHTPVQLEKLTIEADHKSLNGWFVVEDLKTKGRTAFLNGRIQGGDVSLEETESIVSDAETILQKFRAKTADLLLMGNAFYKDLDVQADYFSLSNMRAQSASLQANEGACLLNCSIGHLFSCILNGGLEANYLTVHHAKIQAQSFKSLRHLNVVNLDLKSQGPITILDMHIKTRAHLQTNDNCFVHHATGNHLDVTAQNLAIINGDQLTKADVTADHAIVLGDAKNIDIQGKKTASFEGSAEQVKTAAISSSVTADQDGIQHLKQTGHVASATGIIGTLEANARYNFLTQAQVQTLKPDDRVHLTTFGDTKIVRVLQENGQSFDLSNHGALTVVDEAVLNLHHFFNDGCVQFLSPSAVKATETFTNDGNIKGTGSLSVDAPSEFGLGDIHVAAFNQFLNETPIKGESYDYAPFDENGLKPTQTYTRAILSDFDNQSGFYALDMDRTYAQHLLIESLKNEKAKSMLAGELLRALLVNDQFLPQEFIEKTKEMVNLYSQSEEGSQEQEEALLSLMNWCMNDDVLIAYCLQCYGQKEFFPTIDLNKNGTYGGLDILAAARGYNLEIYVPFYGSLKKVYAFDAKKHGFEGEFKTRRLIVGEETEHFDLLLTDEEWNERPVFLTQDDAMKGQLNLTLNRCFFADDVLSNPHFKPEHMIHYVLKGQQMIRQNHTFDLKTIIETDAHLDLQAKLKGNQNLSVISGTAKASGFELSCKKLATWITKGDKVQQNGTFFGGDGTVEEVFGSKNQAHVKTGTLESKTQVNVHGDQTDHGQAKDHEKQYNEMHRKIEERYQTPEVCETVGKTLAMHIAGNYQREGSKTESKRGTVIQIGGNSIIVPLMLKREIKKDISGGNRIDTYFDPYASTDRVENGGFVRTVGGQAEYTGADVEAKTIIDTAVKGIKEKTAEKVHQYYQRTVHTSGSCLWKKRREVIEQGTIKTAVPAVYKASDWVNIISEKGSVLFEGAKFDSPFTKVIAPNGKVAFDAAKNTEDTVWFRSFKNWCWQSMRQETTHKETYTQCSTTGKMEVESQEIDLTRVRDHTKKLLDSNILDNLITNGKINEKIVNEVLKIDVVSKGGPSGLLSAVVAIVIAYCTMGLGDKLGGMLCAKMQIASALATKIVTGAVTGAFMAFCSTSALALMNSNGDLSQAFKMIFSSNTVKSVIISAAAMGATNGFCHSFNIPTCCLDRTIVQNIQVGAVGASAGIAARTILYGEKGLHDIHKDGLNVVIQAVCADLCKDIGVLRAGVDKTGKTFEKMDYFSHKLSHAFVGALGGVVHGEEGMISGAAGGALGEVFAECLMDSKAIYQDVMKKNPTATREQWYALAKDKLDFRAKLSKISTAFAVGLFGGDANLGHAAAERAIDNNAFQAAILGLFVYVTYKDYKASYDENGWDGVLNHLHKDAKEIAELEMLCAQIGAGSGLIAAAPGAAAGAVTGFAVGTAAGVTKQIGVRIGKYIVTDANILWSALSKMKGGLDKISSQSSFVKWFEGSSVGQKLGEWNARLAGRGGNADFEAPVVELESKKFIPKGWDRAEDFTFKGRTNKVYQRDDLIDLNRVDPRRPCVGK